MLKVTLEQLGVDIESDWISLQSGDKQRKALIVSIGRKLIKAKRQAKRDRVLWKDWVAENLTMKERQSWKFMSIGRSPDAFKDGMSIDEGAKVCSDVRKGKSQEVYQGGDRKALNVRIARDAHRWYEKAERWVGEVRRERKEWSDDVAIGVRTELQILRDRIEELLLEV